MKLLLLCLFCCVAVHALPKEFIKYIPDCYQNICKRPNCVCSDKNAPISGIIPQFVMLSFDDSVQKNNYEQLFKPLFFGRKNADGCPISGTFFVPHEYSDYKAVNDLYNNGFEIASHSITKNPLMDYWKSINETVLIAEFGGQQTILSKFANIPKNQITGARLPLFQFNRNSLEAIKKAGFTYDNSWAAFQETHWFPYTLDYMSSQQCLTDFCQTTSVPGLWEVPIIDWVDMQNIPCNKLLACSVNGTTNQILDWMKNNFHSIYGGSRAPFSIVVNTAWFTKVQNGQAALEGFLNYLTSLKDVFLVSERQVVEWMRNPVTTDKYRSCQKNPPEAPCTAVNCKLKMSDDSTRYMTSCVPCPNNYPWLNNPEGN